MTQPMATISAEQAEDARAKAFEALLDTAKDYPERATSTQVMYAALAYADATCCAEIARDADRYGYTKRAEDPR